MRLAEVKREIRAARMRLCKRWKQIEVWFGNYRFLGGIILALLTVLLSRLLDGW